MSTEHGDLIYHALNEQTPEMGYDTLKQLLARVDETEATLIIEDLICVAPFYVDTGHKEMDEWMQSLTNAQDQIPARDACFAKWENNVAGLCMADSEGRRAVVFTPDASEPGRVRYTEFDSKGFFSHATFDTYQQAFEDAWKAGYRCPAPGMLDTMAVTQEWAKGMKDTLAVQQHNQALTPSTPAHEKNDAPSPSRRR